MELPLARPSLSSVRGDLRRENARIYSEMYEEGIEPFRGNRLSITVMILCFVVAISAMMLGFYMVYATPKWFLDDFFRDLF